jgi:hypothetical protein
MICYKQEEVVSKAFFHAIPIAIGTPGSKERQDLKPACRLCAFFRFAPLREKAGF